MKNYADYLPLPIYDLDKMLLGLLGDHELIDVWWNSPNKAFEYNTPQQMWQPDTYSQVVKYIYAMAYN